MRKAWKGAMVVASLIVLTLIGMGAGQPAIVVGLIVVSAVVAYATRENTTGKTLATEALWTPGEHTHAARFRRSLGGGPLWRTRTRYHLASARVEPGSP